MTESLENAISSAPGIDEIARRGGKTMSKNKNTFVDTGFSIKDAYYCTLWLFSKIAALGLLALYPVLAPIIKKSNLRRDIKRLFKFNPYSFFKQKQWRYA